MDSHPLFSLRDIHILAYHSISHIPTFFFIVHLHVLVPDRPVTDPVKPVPPSSNTTTTNSLHFNHTTTSLHYNMVSVSKLYQVIHITQITPSNHQTS